MVILALCIFAMLGGVVWLSMMFMDERDALNTKVGGLNSRLDAQAIEITTLKGQVKALEDAAEAEDDDSLGMTTVSFDTLDKYIEHAASRKLMVSKPVGYERYKTGTTDFDVAPSDWPEEIYLLTENEVRNMDQVEVFYLEIVSLESFDTGTMVSTYHGPYTGTVGRLVQ